MESLPEITQLMIQQLQEELRGIDPNAILIITSSQVTYQGKTSNVEETSPLTDAQRIRQKLALYFEDLNNPNMELKDIVAVNGNNKEEKIKSICRKIKLFEDNNRQIYKQLEYCYRLGELLCIDNWGNYSANFLCQELGIRKGKEAFKVAQRTFELYNARGIWNIFQVKHISYRVLARMYESDFKLLMQEAYRISMTEFGDSSIPEEF